MAASVVGRDAELASIFEFVAHMSRESAALVLEGEAGMGKTTLWWAAVEQAEQAGALVLQVQPVESETTLSFAGLGDLFDPVLDRVGGSLPSVQERALTRALAIGDDDQSDLDPRTLRVAVLSFVRALAEERPLLVAIDDSQWLDYASSAALAYGVRRLRSERVGLLLSRRSGLESVLLDELLRSPAGERFTSVQVGSLDDVQLGRVVHEHFGKSLPRPLLAEVRHASGGNPFFALEIVRTLDRSGVSVEAGKPLPVPDSLHDLVHGRLLALPPESRDFLAAAAAQARPTVSITENASGVARAAGLAPALEARVVETQGEDLRFTHPLLAAGALETTDPARRAEIHARLAELVEDPEARAWQLAASVDSPDEAVAAALEAAAEHARLRGALRPAALLLDRAAELTPSALEDEARRRTIQAAHMHFEAGDARRAERSLQQLLASCAPGVLRGQALWMLARIRTYEAPLEAADLFLEVLAEGHEDVELQASAHEGVASSLYYAFERLSDAQAHTEAALGLARQLEDTRLVGDVLISKLGIERLLGDPNADTTVDEALAVQAAAADRRVLDQPALAVAESWLWTDSVSRARDGFSALLSQAEEIGDESSRPYLLFLLGQAECALGELSQGLASGRDGEAAAVQSGQPLFAAYNAALQCLAEAQLGHAEAAEESARRALEHVPVEIVKLFTASGLGHVQLTRGAAANVVDVLAPTLAFVRRESIVEPGCMRFVVDAVEALVELARADESSELLAWYERNARRVERASALANCARCRGLLAAQAGDLDAAMAAFDEALERHGEVDLPLDRARTLLALGVTQRRMKRRREARATLEEALLVFDRIGAALWAERARGELKRISGRAATPGALTPAEERVAVLVAEGRTNKEVAAALFVSDRTVEGHLAHVFGKLGIRHRTEIAGALQTRGIAVSNTGDAPVSAGPPAS